MRFWERILLRIRNYEFWPFHIFYLPTIIYYLFLAAKHRSFFFFSASNPGIETGGMLGEKKWDVFQLIPEKYYPTTLKFRPGIPEKEIIDAMKNHNLEFPVILKPDIGERGQMVEKITNEDQIRRYVKKIKVEFLLQEYVDMDLELGVFYIRHPNDTVGRVTSIVRKGFLTVTGNGEETVFSLLKQNKRAQLQFDFTSDFYKDLLKEVPEKGEIRIIESIGNHCRGTIFYNDNSEIDPVLTGVIDDIARQIPEFFFGRLDIRTTSYDDLRRGKNFSIMELNGAGSEPGHIYDPSYSFWRAQKDVLYHFGQLSTISRANRKRGFDYMPFKAGIRKFNDIRRYKMY